MSFIYLKDNVPCRVVQKAINSFYKRLNAQAQLKHLDNCKSHLLTLLWCQKTLVLYSSTHKKAAKTPSQPLLFSFPRVLCAFVPEIFLQKVQVTFWEVCLRKKTNTKKQKKSSKDDWEMWYYQRGDSISITGEILDWLTWIQPGFVLLFSLVALIQSIRMDLECTYQQVEAIFGVLGEPVNQTLQGCWGFFWDVVLKKTQLAK